MLNTPSNLFEIGLLFLYITGCRPTEAAWVAMARSADLVEYDELKSQYSHVIIMPKKETKTGIDYVWYIDHKYARFVDALTSLKMEHFTRKQMVDRMRHTHDRFIKHDASLSTQRGADGHSLTFRSIRRQHGTAWLQYYERCQVEGTEPMPNPLQHTSTTTIRRHYIDAVTENMMETRQKKYECGGRPVKRLALSTAFGSQFNNSQGNEMRNIAA